MAKRFTDSEKWKKSFIRGLQGAYKLLWFYILDNCNHAGIWDVEFDVAKLRIGENVDKDTAMKVFTDKIQIFDDGKKWFLPSFVDFQYGELSEDNRAHKSVIIILKKYKLDKGLNSSLSSPLQGGKDKDKDKDKELDKDKDKDVKKIIECWNTNDLPKCTKITPERIKIINKVLALNDIGDIVDCIEYYSEAINDSAYFENYKWSLDNFFTRKRGYTAWMKEGEKWQAYINWFNSPEQKKKRGDG